MNEINNPIVPVTEAASFPAINRRLQRGMQEALQADLPGSMRLGSRAVAQEILDVYNNTEAANVVFAAAQETASVLIKNGEDTEGLGEARSAAHDITAAHLPSLLEALNINVDHRRLTETPIVFGDMVKLAKRMLATTYKGETAPGELVYKDADLPLDAESVRAFLKDAVGNNDYYKSAIDRFTFNTSEERLSDLELDGLEAYARMANADWRIGELYQAKLEGAQGETEMNPVLTSSAQSFDQHLATIAAEAHGRGYSGDQIALLVAFELSKDIRAARSGGEGSGGLSGGLGKDAVAAAVRVVGKQDPPQA